MKVGEERLFRYLPHGESVPSGWVLADALDGTHHGRYSVLIVKVDALPYLGQPTVQRVNARKQGLKYYFTGKPYRRAGHISARRTSDRKCITCQRAKMSLYNKAYWEKNREKLLVQKRARTKTPRAKATRAAWTDRNREKLRCNALKCAKMPWEFCRDPFARICL